MKPEIRQSAGYPILLLGGVALLVSTAIGIANLGTHADIARRQLEDLQVTLQQVVPAEYYDNELVRDTVTIQEGDRSVQVYRARRKGQVQAVSFRTTAPGYGSSEMVLIVGVDRDGKLLGVRVISHAETPGLGDKIETSKSNWILGFTGRSLSDPPPAGWGVKKDGGVFDQFTGATITPRAVVKSIKGGLEFFAAHRAVLLDEAGGGHDQ
ncbi:MAG: electron transport complex subunit RsxG [Gammaproteobacteria bacterium]|nr:electron transport complex subunit RsxG [Gammaproteobacteria bacterium]